MKFSSVYLLAITVVATCIMSVHPAEPKNPFHQYGFLQLTLKAIMTEGYRESAKHIKTKIALLLDAIGELPIDEPKNLEVEINDCLNFFVETAYYSSFQFPAKCTAVLKKMMASRKLNKPQNAQIFLESIINHVFRNSATDIGMKNFEKEIITKTIKNRDANEAKHYDCILEVLKNIYYGPQYSSKGSDVKSHAITNELLNIVFDLRDESTETEHADFS